MTHMFKFLALGVYSICIFLGKQLAKVVFVCINDAMMVFLQN